MQNMHEYALPTLLMTQPMYDDLILSAQIWLKLQGNSESATTLNHCTTGTSPTWIDTLANWDLNQGHIQVWHNLTTQIWVFNLTMTRNTAYHDVCTVTGSYIKLQCYILESGHPGFRQIVTDIMIGSWVEFKQLACNLVRKSISCQCMVISFPQSIAIKLGLVLCWS